MKKILIIVIPVIVVLGVVAGILIWYFLPINRINRAFEAEDYELVVETFGALKKDTDIAGVQGRLSDKARVLYKDYVNEKCSYKEIDEYFKLIMEDIFRRDKKIKKMRDEIDEIKKSREEYGRGLEYIEAEAYADAIECFGRVSELDSRYRELADSRIEECKVNYISSVLSVADGFIAAEEYEAAKDAVVAAFELFPEDMALNDKLEEIIGLMYTDIEGKWSTVYDFGNLIAQELGLKGYELYFPAELVFEFIDNSFRMYVEESSIKPALDAMTADAASMEALYVVAEQYGVNKFEADILVTLMYGGSYSAFLMDQYGAEISDALDSFNYSSVYSADSKKVYIGTLDRNTDNYYFYVQNESILSLEEYVGNNIPMNIIEYPLKLKRKIT